jgi:hypothetical protein
LILLLLSLLLLLLFERERETMANTRYPAYQIDFTAVAAGKRVAATKRRVRWYVTDSVTVAQ